jgi:hypothetical protein
MAVYLNDFVWWSLVFLVEKCGCKIICSEDETREDCIFHLMGNILTIWELLEIYAVYDQKHNSRAQGSIL